MNYRKIFSTLGSIMLVEAALLMIPLMVCLVYKEYGEHTIPAFITSIGATALTGLLCKIKKPVEDRFYAKEGYLLCALTWVVLSAFGALPFVISKAIPNFIDAFFETVSGFTTTGSTILTEIEGIPHSILFWRSFTHFIGGMGILVFVIAIIPKTEGSTMHVMRAEVPGPTVGKLVSKLRASARILYGMYCAITAVMIILLKIGGMDWFDCITNAFATAGTGGFSILNSSIEGYGNVYYEMVIAVFMVIFGINFNLYYFFLIKQGKQALKDEEMHWFLGIITASTFIIALDLSFSTYSIPNAFRYAFFHVASIISTTGFQTTVFENWPTLSKMILFMLMFIGGCAGSTGGGLKVSRIVVLVKSGLRSIRKAFNPRTVESIKLNNKPVDEETVRGVNVYFGTYMLILALSILVVSIFDEGMIENISGVVSCFNNIGPGFGKIGLSGNFSEFSAFSKLILSLDMLAGRLELIPVFMLFSKYIIPRKWS